MSDPRSSPELSATGRAHLDGVARKYYGPLLAFFRKRTGNSLDVQDLVQQVFLKLAQYQKIAQVENPDAYIFRTAANALKDMRRRNLLLGHLVVKPLAEMPEEEEIDADFSPERVLLGKEAVRLLVDALRDIPEKSRDIFILRCFEGLKHADIAKVQHLSERMVKKHIARVLAQLKDALE